MPLHFRLLLLLALTAFVVATVRVAFVLPRYSFINNDNASGTWATLAMDLSEGVLYRPLISKYGYGGTRYFPLEFTLHAAFIKLGLSVPAAGHVVGVSAILLLLWSLSFIMQELGIRREIAWPCLGLLTITIPISINLTRVGSDGLSSAFSFAAIAVVLSAHRSKTSPAKWAAAAALFAAAFLSKQTSLTLVTTVCVWLLLSRRWFSALFLAAMALLVSYLGFEFFNHFSQQRMVNTGTLGHGVITVQSMLGGPQKFLLYVAKDPLLIVPGLAALSGIVRDFRSSWKELPTLLLAAGSAGLCIIYGQPGTEFNHLIEFAAPAFLALAYQLEKERLNRQLGAYLLLGAGLINLGMTVAFGFKMPWYSEADPRPAYAQMKHLVGTQGGPLLCENAWACILLGERPFLMDAMATRIGAIFDEEIRKDFEKKMDEHFFRALIVRSELKAPDAQQWYEDINLGPGFPAGFVEQALKNYEFRGVFASNYVYTPKNLPAQSE